MRLEEFTIRLKKYHDFWDQDIYADYVIEEFVVKELSNISVEEYDLYDLLGSRLLKLIVRYGEDHLSCGLRGGRIIQLRGA